MPRIALRLLPIAAIVHCGSPTAPPPALLQDIPYTLRSINGKPLPFSVCAPNDPCGSAYVALTLTFHKNLRVNYDQTSTSPSVQGLVYRYDTLAYDLYHTTVTIFYGTTEIAADSYSDSATVQGHHLVLSAKRQGTRYRMDFTAPLFSH